MRTMSTVAMLALMPTLAAGHGYISKPASRAFGCKRGNGVLENRDCGDVQYEPQSVEGNDGSPRYPQRAANEIPDGRIASANRAGGWGKLDEQSGTRWDKVAMSSGWNVFTWTFTAAHSTNDFRYWITKEGWNAEEALTRGTFEEAPFCTVSLNGAMAATNPSHECFVPQRTGYAIVLGVWDVADTDQSFYNVIDVLFDGSTAGSLPPTVPPRETDATASTDAPAAVPAGCGQRDQRCFLDGGCCSADDVCVEGFANAGWYKCVDKKEVTEAPPATSARATTTRAPGTPCVGEVRAWGPCLGREGCCPEGWYCFAQSQWYSQCVPKPTN